MKSGYTWQDRITFVVSVAVALVAVWFWTDRERVAAGAFAVMAVYNFVAPILNRNAWNNAYVLGHATAISHLMETFREHEIVGQSTLQRWAMHELHDTAELYRRAAE